MCNTIVLVVLMMTFFLSRTPLQAQETKSDTKKLPTAAVLDFRAQTMIKADELVALSNKFRTSLAQTKQFTLLERADMENILKEQDFSMTDMCNTAECAVEVGQLLAAEKMITGDLGKVGDTYTVTVRIIDVSTGKVERTASQEYKGETEGLIKAFDVLAQKLTGIYKANTTLWYTLGGVGVAAGSALVAIFLSKSGGKSTSVGKPPADPQIP
ncbi:MAG: DUF2380 domain-containing protein [Bacteroidetes bacterium]|nr:DUF2380 domain-containing protein [Bacteroidota bacterium]